MRLSYCDTALRHRVATLRYDTANRRSRPRELTTNTANKPPRLHLPHGACYFTTGVLIGSGPDHLPLRLASGEVATAKVTVLVVTIC